MRCRRLLPAAKKLPATDASCVADAIRTCNKLKFVWNRADNSIKWKTQGFHSTLRSELMYGLEAIQPTKNELARFNAFKMNGHRRVLRCYMFLSPLSIESFPQFNKQTFSNEVVVQMLQELHDVKIVEFCDTWLCQKRKLLGHVFRTNTEDQLRLSSLCLSRKLAIARLEFFLL